MVLILSNNFNPTVDNIIQWLEFYNVKYYRLCSDTKIHLLELSEEHFVFEHNHFQISSHEIDGYVNMNGKINLHYGLFATEEASIPNFVEYTSSIVKDENDIIANHIYNILESLEKKISNYYYNSNKLTNLAIAKKVGFNIPKSIVTSKYSHLVNKFPSSTRIITKILGNSFNYIEKDVTCKSYTEDIIIDQMINERFSYSLFQENIEKDIEIRSFFFKGVIYSMAIFSQYETVANTDHRRNTKNRNAPYKLPHVIEKRISVLMKRLHLDSASIDFIKTVSGEYYFLEVNPSGQFGNVSYNCNYHLEEKIVKYLISYETHYRRNSDFFAE